jgi:hypothetical protein
VAGVARGWRRRAARRAAAPTVRRCATPHGWPCASGGGRRSPATRGRVMARRGAVGVPCDCTLPLVPPSTPCPRPPSQSPNSFFMDVRCSGCMTITTVFSHATNVRYRRRSGSSARPRHSFLPRSRGRLSATFPLLPSSHASGGRLRLLRGHALPADGRQGTVDRGLLLPEEARVRGCVEE